MNCPHCSEEIESKFIVNELSEAIKDRIDEIELAEIQQVDDRTPEQIEADNIQEAAEREAAQAAYNKQTKIAATIAISAIVGMIAFTFLMINGYTPAFYWRELTGSEDITKLFPAEYLEQGDPTIAAMEIGDTVWVNKSTLSIDDNLQVWIMTGHVPNSTPDWSDVRLTRKADGFHVDLTHADKEFKIERYNLDYAKLDGYEKVISIKY